jgi:hypothetical protein
MQFLLLPVISRKVPMPLRATGINKGFLEK